MQPTSTSASDERQAVADDRRGRRQPWRLSHTPRGGGCFIVVADQRRRTERGLAMFVWWTYWMRAMAISSQQPGGAPDEAIGVSERRRRQQPGWGPPAASPRLMPARSPHRVSRHGDRAGAATTIPARGIAEPT
jgi:hypothetical protein